jgi:ribosomal-protein-alanine N-acetyltransferase
MFRIKRITETSSHLKKYLLQIRIDFTGDRPSFDDIDCFLSIDSGVMCVGELDGKPIGVASVFKYEEGYRHGGGYYMEKEYRKHGYGIQLFNHVVEKSKPIVNISSYINSPEIIEMYRKYFGGGEILFSVNTYALNLGTALKKLQEFPSDAKYCQVKPASEVNFETLFRYDKHTFGYSRKQFLYKWLYSPASHSRVALDGDGSVLGYIVLRKSMVPNEGYKIGPLFCENIDVGKDLTRSVLEGISEEGTPSSILIRSPIDKNPQVKELLTLLDGTNVDKHTFLSTNGQPKGCHDKWFAVTSIFCG